MKRCEKCEDSFFPCQECTNTEDVNESSLNELLSVVGVAIMAKGCMMCSLSRPNRHHNVIHAMARSGMKTPITGQQGFILSNGKFASRTCAKEVATKAGQLLERSSNGNELFSECVW